MSPLRRSLVSLAVIAVSLAAAWSAWRLEPPPPPFVGAGVFVGVGVGDVRCGQSGIVATAGMRWPAANIPSDCAKMPSTFPLPASTSRKSLPLAFSVALPAISCRLLTRTPFTAAEPVAASKPSLSQNRAAAVLLSAPMLNSAPYESLNAATITRLPSCAGGARSCGLK